MKQLRFSSFRQRLNAAFLAVSLVPVLLCSALLLQIFRLRMTADQLHAGGLAGGGPDAGWERDGAWRAFGRLGEQRERIQRAL